MEIRKYNRIVKRLSVIFIATFIIVGIVSNSYVIMEIKKGNNPITMLSSYQIFSLLLGIFVYIPLMLAIHRYTRLANMKKAIWISKVILYYLIFSEAIMLFATAVEIWKRFLFNAFFCDGYRYLILPTA